MIETLLGALLGALLTWWVATGFFVLSMTEYDYIHVVGGFTMLGAAVGALIGFGTSQSL